MGLGSGKVHEHMSQALDLYTPRSASCVSSRRALSDAEMTLTMWTCCLRTMHFLSSQLDY